MPPNAPSRPSTAPPQQVKPILPSLPAVRPPMTTVSEDVRDISPASALSGFLPSPLGDSDLLPSCSHTGDTAAADYNWATFIRAYALGRWDPNRIPNPPRSHVPPSEYSVVSHSPPDKQVISAPFGPDVLSRPHQSPFDPPQSVFPSSTDSLPFPRFRPETPTRLSLPPHRLRNSFSTPSAPTSDLPFPSAITSSPSNADVCTTAAALRWAGASVNIAPLALPSPEHELTDPMRGVTATVPGSHSDLRPHHSDPVIALSARKLRLGSFWAGTTDVEEEHDGTALLTSFAAAAPECYSTAIYPGDRSPLEPCDSHIMDTTHAASAPLVRSFQDGDLDTTDYFHVDAAGPSATQVPSPMADDKGTLNTPAGTLSVPALPRKVCLTRQASSPLPISSPREPAYTSTAEGISSVKAARAAKEEQMFAELGFLAPPNPPEELERRRALYQFNIWNTGPDLNFDRIVHLSKLVFNTKGVTISLIDGNEQWFKSEWGMTAPGHARAHSFCAHVILQRGDEPMVILDTHVDWRFTKNPLVQGVPHIRFYAGAPLRTQDGYNIGTLAIFDDVPRQDFSPRQRHTLKEFAAITMREMELWRDKIQLRIRDRIQNSMEQFSRECLEIDTEPHGKQVQQQNHVDLIVGSSMDKVYDHAAKLVKRTLDVEGVIVMDVSHCEVLESMSAEGTVSVILHYGDPQIDAKERQLSAAEFHQLNAFFAKHPDGKISEGIVPPCFRPFLPTHIQYALTVPIFNIDKRPFALLCAYNVSDQTKRYLEGHELSYLRAIGVIILSAVLKRRMILADKAKSLFISNISHELRTPLHGILAAAELLNDTLLNHSQLSFLQTVQACGISLVETVNHVLDFTKLSGNTKAGGVEKVIVLTNVDLMQLVEEAVDGCWVGHRARSGITGDSGIGSVYSPPQQEDGSTAAAWKIPVETVIDIGYRAEGWTLKCEKGGIRRVLMNLFGNSLKFTEKGFIHVMLREIPLCETDPQNKIKIELAVIDTGKGISQNFLKNQLFHPFSQENPLQTGTGLGLAIVNSIVTSESVGGKVDVWSEEGAGTEIKVTFFAEKPDEDDGSWQIMRPLKAHHDLPKKLMISLVGFDEPHEGIKLLQRVIEVSLTCWGFSILREPGRADIVIVNDDPSLIDEATQRHDTSTPFILLSASRGNPRVMAIATDHERIGGFCRILFKPGGPSRLRAILKLSLHALKIGTKKSQGPSPNGSTHISNDATYFVCIVKDRSIDHTSIPRRNSEEHWRKQHSSRPQMALRSSTAHPLESWKEISPECNSERSKSLEVDPNGPTVSIGSGGSLLKKSAIGTQKQPEHCFRVLVVEDNAILRNLLIKWLTQKGYDLRDAADGQEGVNLYKTDGPFDVVLLDLSMPVLDGVAATAEIRRFESTRFSTEESIHAPIKSTRILALTGMSSLEDKRRAFEAGVDGYLVKPVAFKTLDEMFHRLGIY